MYRTAVRPRWIQGQRSASAPPLGRLARRRVIAIDGRRSVEAGEGEESLGVRARPAEPADRADAGKRNGRQALAAEAVDLHLVLCIDEVAGDELAADQAGAFQRLLRLRNHRHRRNPADRVDRQNLLQRRVLVGLEEEAAALVADIVPLV